MATLADVINYLSSNAARIQVFHLPPGASAPEVASAHGITAGEVATIGLYRAERRYVMTVIPADSRVNLRVLRDVVQAKETMRASGWDRVRLFPGCDVSAIPPLGNLYGILVVADSGFEQLGGIAFKACVSTASIRMDWNDYRRLVDPIVAPIAEPSLVHEATIDTEE